MSQRKHLTLLLQGSLVWLFFWLLGLPSSYYQEYSTVVMAVASILISIVTSLAAVWLLQRGRDESRMSRAFWLSFYYTLPFAVLDAIYCGWYLGYGADFLSRFWYLSVFYIAPWLTFMPTAALLSSSRDTGKLPASPIN